MNRLNAKAKRKRFDGHFITLFDEWDWIIVAIRCVQFYRPSAFPCMAIIPEAKEYWNGNKGAGE